MHIDPQKVLLNYPIDRSLELVDEAGRVVLKPPLAEAILPSDPTSDTWWRNHTFNGYSPSGNVEAPVVYANFGFPEDFAALKAAGVDVRGKVALMRYGKCFRGLKAMNAETNGAIAALIYSDPEQDGFAKGTVYPGGPWRPPSSVQRGSIQVDLGGSRLFCLSPHLSVCPPIPPSNDPPIHPVPVSSSASALAILHAQTCPPARQRSCAATTKASSSRTSPCYRSATKTPRRC